MRWENYAFSQRRGCLLPSEFPRGTFSLNEPLAESEYIWENIPN